MLIALIVVSVLSLFFLKLRKRAKVALAAGTTAIMTVFAVAMPSVWAAQPTVDLGTAAPFAVLAHTTVTNTGPSVISGDLGLSPGSSVTNFPPGQVINGVQHVADPVALQAQNDLVTAYNDAAGRTPVNSVSADLGGQTLVPGVYNSASSLGLTGTVTLNAQGDPSAVFIFQAGSTLTTASSSRVALIGEAQSCNVFWQVGSSATLGTSTTFVGTVMALDSVAVQTNATVDGRVLARTGAVTLDSNTITAPTCATTPTTTTTTTTPTTTTTTTTPTTTTTTTTPTTTTTTTTPTAGVIPKGAPGTGAGGASHSSNDTLLALGGVALLGGSAAMIQAIRRRRILPGQQRHSGDN